MAANLCSDYRIWLGFGGLQRHHSILFKVGFCNCIYVHTHLPTRIYTVHNVSLWLLNNENDSHNRPQKESDYFIITPGLRVHAPCHWMPVKEVQTRSEELCPGHQKTVLCNEEKHMLWSPPLIYVPLDKWFNLSDSVSAHIKWRKFYINCETGVRIKWNNLQESACHVLSPWQTLQSCSNIADSWSCNSTHFKVNTITFSIFSTS